jgi:hypothetical protein
MGLYGFTSGWLAGLILRRLDYITMYDTSFELLLLWIIDIFVLQYSIPLSESEVLCTTPIQAQTISCRD